MDRKVFIIAGEASGDMHGADLIASVKENITELKFFGIGGAKLENAGMEIINRYSEINFVGFSSVFLNLSKIKLVLKNAVQKVREIKPDIIILIDFPGFNLKFAELIRKFYKGKIIYYISPQVWAWHKSRVKKIKKLIDRMLVIFPFEVDFYKREGINADFVGHPLINKTENFLSNNQKEKSNKTQVTLLPGSRIEEVKKILPIMAESAVKFKNSLNAEINIIYPNNIELQYYKSILLNESINYIRNIDISYYKAIQNSDIVITKFGTPTFECALIGTPFIAVYKTGRLNYLIAKSLAKVNYVAMVNILLHKEVVKEYIQKEFTARNIFEEGKRILSDNDYKSAMLYNFKEMRDIFTNSVINKSASDIIVEDLRG